MLYRLVILALLTIAAAASGAELFRIGSSNIEHLGSRTPGQRPIAIAEHVDLSSAVAVAFEEIDVTETQADDPGTVYFAPHVCHCRPYLLCPDRLPVASELTKNAFCHEAPK